MTSLARCDNINATYQNHQVNVSSKNIQTICCVSTGKCSAVVCWCSCSQVQVVKTV